ncbi:MAG: lysylphosphatidylglycerol synthase transmembrane domain-containing protein [Thermomicrobiales bacterium]
MRNPRTIVSLLLAVVVIVFAFRSLDVDPQQIIGNLKRANPALVLLALGVWYAAMFGRAARWRWMLAKADIDDAHGYTMPPLTGFVQILLLAWFANSLVPAKLGDAWRCWLLKQDSGAPFSASLGTLVSERLADVAVLCLTMTLAGFAAFGGQLPPQAATAVKAGAALVVVALAFLAVIWRGRDQLAGRMPARIQGPFSTISNAMVGSLRAPLPLGAMSAGLWLMDGVRFWLVAAALGAGMSYPAALFVVLLASLLSAVPLTPAGLGVVEAGAGAVMVGVLGMDPGMAMSILLLDRVVSYWNVIVAGSLVYLRRMAEEVRRSRLAVTAAAARPD